MNGQPAPSVSVVIPHYGDPTLTLRLTGQLRSQEGQSPHQIIVVDDRSPEPFPDVPGVLVVRRDRNGGFGTAVNAGAREATGDLLLILNSDLTIEATFLADLVRAAGPWLPAIVGPRILDADGHCDYSARDFPTVGHQVTEWLTPLARWRDADVLHKAVGHDLRALDDRAVVVDWLVGAALLLPTDVFHASGGFDERFFMNCEEVDLQRRLRSRGIPSVALPSPAVVHLGGGSSDPAKRRRWVVGSRFQYAEKWGGATRLRLGLSAATAANLAWNTGRRLAGAPIDPLAPAREEWLSLIHI